MRAVVLLVCLAVVALQAGSDLRANTNSVADLNSLYIIADLDSASDNLVANAKRHGSIAPASSDSVNIRTTDTASVDSNVNVAVTELLQFELNAC
jgi:hypothetical protein